MIDTDLYSKLAGSESDEQNSFQMFGGMSHDLAGNFFMEGSLQGMQLKEALKLLLKLEWNQIGNDDEEE